MPSIVIPPSYAVPPLNVTAPKKRAIPHVRSVFEPSIAPIAAVPPQATIENRKHSFSLLHPHPLENLTTKTFSSKDNLVAHLWQTYSSQSEIEEPEKTLKGIQQSLLPTENFSQTADFDDATKRRLGLSDNIGIQVTYAKNSAANGLRYLEKVDGEEKKFIVSNAVTSSFNRAEKDKMSVFRLIENQNGHVIAYAGRPNTEAKAEELVKGIYARECVNKRGMQEVGLKGTIPVVEMSFVVESTLSSSKTFCSKERKLLDEEHRVLQNLPQREFLCIDPLTGNKAIVRPRPIFIAQQFNFLNRLEKILPSQYSGEAAASKMSAPGVAELKSMANEALARGHPQSDLLKNILPRWNVFESLAVEEKLCLTALLTHILNVPLVEHCKSTTDRTAIMIAITAACKQWLVEKRPFPRDTNGTFPERILDDEAFKELFFFYLKTGNNVAKISRGSNGMKWEAGNLLEHPALARLLPDRCLKETSLNDYSCKELAILMPSLVTAAATDTYVNKKISDWCNEPRCLAKRSQRIAAVCAGSVGASIQLPFLLTASATLDIGNALKNRAAHRKAEKPFKALRNLSSILPKKRVNLEYFRANGLEDLFHFRT